ncbi:MAG: zf-HC2 domain-containing protein [Candidatus Acidiferrales bacterium]
MNCERIEKQMIAYMDGRASSAERREVEAHLADCGACRTRAEEFRLLWGVLDEAPQLEVSPAFDARLRARIAAEPSRPGLWGRLVPSPRLALAVSLLLVLSVWISSVPAPGPAVAEVAQSEAEFKMIKDLPVLEDYDVLANFEALSELPPRPVDENRPM